MNQFPLWALSALLFLSACSKEPPQSPSPTSDFTYTGAGTAPATVHFTNTSKNATSYAWDCGDNATSTQVSPNHTYSKAGVYTVKLTATGSSTSAVTSKTVNIAAPSSVKITGVKVVQLPFTNTSGGGWDNNSGPDVSYSITDATDHVLVNPTTYFPNVTSSQLPLSFSLTTPLPGHKFCNRV